MNVLYVTEESDLDGTMLLLIAFEVAFEDPAAALFRGRDTGLDRRVRTPTKFALPDGPMGLKGASASNGSS